MSNARVRQYLEGMSAPVVAWLIDHKYVADDCGILNVINWQWKDGVRLAHSPQYGCPQNFNANTRVRERL